MSYILDALRKADAQRESDASRGIHAHPTPLGASGSRTGPPAWGWGVAAVVVALVGWGGWSLVQDRSAPPAAAPVTVSASPAVPPPAVTATPAAQAPTPAAAIVPPPPAPAIVAPAPSMRAVQSRETFLAQGVGAPPMASSAPAPQPRPFTPAAPNVAPPAAPIAGLPPDAPRVSISGGVYSTSPAQRMLIVNGQVYNEGSEIAPGLAIDEIKPRTAVLKFRGARYNVAY